MKNKLLSMLLAAVMVFNLIPNFSLAAESENKVRVVVKNTVFTPETAEGLGAEWSEDFWHGNLVDEWVDLKSDSTYISCFLDALDNHGYTQEGAESNYITKINGLAAYDGGYMSGWIGTLNDWFINEGFGSFTVANGNLEAGDEIGIMYSCAWGADVGSDWSSNDTGIKNIEFSVGELDNAFSSDIYNYVLTVPANTTGVVVTPTAINKNFQVRASIDGTEYKRSATLPISHGTEIIVKCGDPSWPSMNASERATEYTFTVEDAGVKANVTSVQDKINAIGTVSLSSSTKIKQARTAYDKLTDVEKALVNNYAVLTSAEETYSGLLVASAIEKIDAIGTVTLDSNTTISAARTAFNKLSDTEKEAVTNANVLFAAEDTYYDLAVKNAENALTETQEYLIDTVKEPTVGNIAGEWVILGLSRSFAEVPEDYYENYYKKVEEYVKANINENNQLHSTKSTDNSRVIIALTAIGKDPQNVAGYNLLKGLTDLTYVTKQGINGPVWALIALDTCNFEIPETELKSTTVTRDALVDYILNKELQAGGWALSGTAADPDITGAVLQALAPYYDTNSKVKTAVDKAVETLSDIQQENGGFASWGNATAESCAQVITGLTSLGINPDKDPRFIKNNKSALGAMLNYYVSNGGFRHTLNGKLNQIATEQCFYALVSCFRLEEELTPLYDMSDVITDKQIAESIEYLIDEIGKVTLKSGEYLAFLRETYDSLTDYQKGLVRNYNVLVKAEKTFASLKNEKTEEITDIEETDVNETSVDLLSPKTGYSLYMCILALVVICSGLSLIVFERKKKII